MVCSIAETGSEKSVSWEEEEEERRCVRCSRTFFMLKSGTYSSYDTCSYHWGKLR
jgi:hypothetical protein